MSYITVYNREAFVYNSECNICCDNFLDTTDKKCYYLSCGHLWHAACLNDWLKNSKTCPLCNRQIYALNPYKSHIKFGFVFSLALHIACFIRTIPSFSNNDNSQELTLSHGSFHLNSLILSNLCVGLVFGNFSYFRERIKSKKNKALLKGPIDFQPIDHLSNSQMASIRSDWPAL